MGPARPCAVLCRGNADAAMRATRTCFFFAACHVALQQRWEADVVKWRSLPDSAQPPVQWVGRKGGEDVAWVVQWRRWGDPLHQWQVATAHGTASGLSATLQQAQRSAEAVLRVYGAGSVAD